MTMRVSDYKTRNDPRFNTTNSRNVRLQNRSFVGYSQNFNSGTQALPALTRTQLTNNALGANTFSSARLWNPINNRMHLLDSRVGDYIDAHIVIPIDGAPALPNLIVELDFSPALDGSQVIGRPQSVSVFALLGDPEFDFKFAVTSAMKANGVAIMVTPSGAFTSTSSELMLENYPTTTS